MTLVDYDNDNSHANVKKMFVLLSPRNKFDGSGGLEPLGIYTSIEFSAANAYGIGIGGSNVGTAVAHVDVNMLPDPLLGRGNKQYYPSIFVHGARVVGTYLDEAQRDRFGVIPEKPILPWDAIKINRFNDLNVAFGDMYQERVRTSEYDEYRGYFDRYSRRKPDEYKTAYAICIITPSSLHPPVISDIAAIFYGEPNSKQEAVERAEQFRRDNPAAPRLMVVPLPVNASVEAFNHEMFTARNRPETMPYFDTERTGELDVREYENMLSEVARIHNTKYIEDNQFSVSR
jgi:hypothetical protein